MRPLLLALLLALLVPLPFADAQATAPTLAAAPTAPGLVVWVNATGSGFRGSVLLTHRDAPLGHDVVDAWQALDLAGDAHEELRFGQVRPDVPVQIRLLPEGAGPDRMANVALYDDASLARVDAGISALVVPPAPSASSPLALHEVRATYGIGGDASGRTQLVQTSDGFLVVAHEDNGTLRVASSADGGRTWGPDTPTPEGGRLPAYWTMAAEPEGKVTIVSHGYSFPYDPNAPSTPWMFSTFDPKTWHFEDNWSVNSIPYNGEVNGVGDVWIAPDGSALVAEPSWDGQTTGIGVWRATAGGDTTRVATLSAPSLESLRIGGNGTHVAILAQSSAPADRIYFASSPDGGATWSVPSEVQALTRYGYDGLELGDVRVDASGFLHAAVSGFFGGHPADGLYVRSQGGAPTATRMGVAELHPTIALGANRIAFPTLLAGGYVLRESADGGSTFSDVPLGDTASGFNAPLLNAALVLTGSGRPVLAGSEGGTLAVAPAFDPLAPPVTSLVVVDPAPTPAPAPSTPPPSTPVATAPTAATPTTATPPPVTTTTETAPTPTTPTPPAEQPLPIVGVSPAIVSLAAGGSADITVTFYNAGETQVGSEAPTFTGLPAGVHAQAQDEGFRVVDGGRSYVYPVRLVADADAPNASALAAAHARYATDRPALNATFHVLVGAAASAVPPGAQGSGFAMQVPAAAYVMVGTGAAAGLVVILVRTDSGKWIAALATLPLYTRLVKADVLGNEVRAGIHAFVARHPGARLSEVQRGVDVSTSTLVFHLRVLEREGYLTTSREWSRRRYWVTGNVPVAHREARDVAATLTEILAREPGLGPAAVAARLGISRQLARYHLRALEREGVVVAQGEGIAKGYVLAARR